MFCTYRLVPLAVNLCPGGSKCVCVREREREVEGQRKKQNDQKNGDTKNS